VTFANVIGIGFLAFGVWRLAFDADDQFAAGWHSLIMAALYLTVGFLLVFA
jgi:uncharacterized membrane protein HdeD (DUF308 family)